MLFISCAPELAFESEDIWICKTDYFSGYFVPDVSQYKGMLYVDEGNLYAKEYSVVIKELFGKTYMKSDEFSYTRCQFTPYSNPAYHDCPDGIDYIKPQFEVKDTSDVKYGRADGYWTSYPNVPENNFGEIFLLKVPIKYFVGQYPQDLTLDVYEPDDGGDHLRPLIIMIHGGGFYNGDKADDEYQYWCKRFAECGYTAVSVNYRLGFGLAFSIKQAAYCALQDVNAAIRYMLSHRETYKINSDLIFLAGCSAGAITALHAAFINDSISPAILAKETTELGPVTAVPVLPEYKKPIAIRAVGNMWGAVMDTSIIKASPTSIISFHDKYDPIVPYGIGVPFEKSVTDYLRELTTERISNWGGALTQKIIPSVFGSSCIDSLALQIGKRTKLLSYERNTHTLIRDQDFALNGLLDSIFIEMNLFFADEMNIHPIEIRQDGYDKQIFYIDDASYVNDCSWSIKGGFITDAIDLTKVRILLIKDCPEHIIKAKGINDTGIAFEELYDLSYD